MVYANNMLVFGGLTTSTVYGFKYEPGRTLTPDNQVRDGRGVASCLALRPGRLGMYVGSGSSRCMHQTTSAVYGFSSERSHSLTLFNQVRW